MSRRCCLSRRVWKGTRLNTAPPHVFVSGRPASPLVLEYNLGEGTPTPNPPSTPSPDLITWRPCAPRSHPNPSPPRCLIMECWPFLSFARQAVHWRGRPTTGGRECPARLVCLRLETLVTWYARGHTQVRRPGNGGLRIMSYSNPLVRPGCDLPRRLACLPSLTLAGGV